MRGGPSDILQADIGGAPCRDSLGLPCPPLQTLRGGAGLWRGREPAARGGSTGLPGSRGCDERWRLGCWGSRLAPLGWLCACAGPPSLAERTQIDAYDDARCTGYGLKPIDPGYARCRHALAQMRIPGDPQADLAALTLERFAQRSPKR